MHKKDHIIIQLISPTHAHDICKKITADLPAWFGLPDVNEQYAQGMLSRISFAANIGDEYIGLCSLEFPYPNNANIYWLGIMRKFHHQGIGSRLLREAENYATLHGAESITVETLSPIAADNNYLKTYNFYLNNDFKPLFDLKPYSPDHKMVYMYKQL